VAFIKSQSYLTSCIALAGLGVERDSSEQSQSPSVDMTDVGSLLNV